MGKMKISNRIFTALLVGTLAISITGLHANTNRSVSMPLSEEQGQEQEMLEILLKDILKQLDDIDLLLEEISLVVDNNGVKVDNKRHVLETIQEQRKIVQRIKNDAYVDIDASGIQTLVHFAQVLTKQIRRAVAAGLDSLEELDLEA